MQPLPRRLWPVVKALIGLAILAFVAWRLGRDLSRPEMDLRRVRPAWLALSGLLYLGSLTCSAFFWRRLLAHGGSPLPALPCLRAYFTSGLAKYVPGKALAVIVRVGLIRPFGPPAALGGVTTFVEVLTYMGTGAIVAAVL